jgi:uncharacterized LabA/DUF88 family protein
MAEHTERRTALFIDFENLVTNTGITAENFDLRPALDRLLERGKVIFRRAYCDWSRFRDAKAGLHEQGVELIDVPPSTRAGKNAADMRLVIDALELCYAREHIDTFVIASGDSDFCPLAYKLRENDKTVVGIGIRGSTSPFFVRACDEFLYLPTPTGGRRGKEGGKEGGKEHKDHKEHGRERERPRKGEKSEKKAPEVPAIAREVVASLLSRTTDPLNPSLIKETIVRKEPDFDERDHGFSSFVRLLQAMESQRLLKLQQHGRQTYVVHGEGASAEPAREEDEVIPDPDE